MGGDMAKKGEKKNA